MSLSSSLYLLLGPFLFPCRMKVYTYMFIVLYIRVPPYSGLVDTYRILTNEISESHLLGVTFNYKDIFLSVHLVEVTFNCRYF